MLVGKQTPRKNVQLVNPPSENTTNDEQHRRAVEKVLRKQQADHPSAVSDHRTLIG